MIYCKGIQPALTGLEDETLAAYDRQLGWDEPGTGPKEGVTGLRHIRKDLLQSEIAQLEKLLGFSTVDMISRDLPPAGEDSYDTEAYDQIVQESDGLVRVSRHMDLIKHHMANVQQCLQRLRKGLYDGSMDIQDALAAIEEQETILYTLRNAGYS
ncbi:hypothetical protein GF351_00660 [Candidatus Woesearchaeota archaeon]|nr:hypothetical protein [Candidatus Woesearchaeota archaeon]